jgi:parallel beta-helix repeat protein
VQLRPGDNVASIVSGAAPGTTFSFSAGTYQGVSIQPKANMVFVGSGAVLVGNGRPYAFRSGAANVTIRGFVIEGYRPAEKEAVIHPDGGARNWSVVGNEIRNNGEVGVKANEGWRIVGNFIHHNGRYGITGSGSGILIEDNEISYNATEYGATGASGGTKFVHTSGLVIRGNNSHHNHGNGLWVDINNVNALIEHNRVVANERNGIFLEISCGGVIRNNYAEGNGTVPKNENWMGGSSGILVSVTPNVEVYGNTLVNNYKGIGALHWDHPNVGNVNACNPELRNLKVHHNSITQNGGAAAGIEAPIQTENVLSNWGNQFYSNTYQLSGGAQYRLRASWVSTQEWSNAGFN